MSIMERSEVIQMLAAKLQDAADRPPAGGFDGRISLPLWLAQSARDQAERVFLVLDGTPVERRDLGEAERLVETSGRTVLMAWADLMEAFGTGNEPWAREALKVAARTYADRLDELGPSIHAGGRA